MDWKELAKASPEELRKVKYDDLRLDAFANEVERKYNLPRDLLVAVKNAGERSNTGQVSEDKAEGVMQFIPSTRKLYPHDVNNPFASIDAAGRYFKDLMKMSKGNVKAAVAQYHGGTKERQAVMAGSEPSGPKTRAYWERMSTYMRERSKTWEDAPVASASNVPKNTAKTHDGLPARKNADGSHSTEVSITVTDPRLNDGKPTNIPSLWGGKEVDEDTAIKNALNSGNAYKSFGSIKEAVDAARAKSAAGGANAPSFQENDAGAVVGMSVHKNGEPPVVAEQPAQPPTVMAVAPTQERVLPDDSGGSRLPSVAEK